MGHPKVFFRIEELNNLQEQYSNDKEIIDNQVDHFLSNVNSKEGLYYQISLLDNSQEYFDSFKNTALAIENFGKSSVLNNRPLYADPFSYVYNSGFDLSNPETLFYFTIGLGVLFVILLFTKLKDLKKFVFLLVIIFSGWNAYNYYVAEPEYIAQKKESLDLDEYKDRKLKRKATDKFVEYYEPIQRYNSRKVYTYDVEGSDANDDDVHGTVETSGKYGEGIITDSYGNEIEIETEWVDKGELIGRDKNGNEYYMSVSH
ncbi:hypothetical protein MKO06_03820 [Gramella sp. GC03-9]|uniref:Uncharacterized protein n=1 Tax=Christiangramia oceanisediminis TaxID=2920386 RepID=A0A9X2I445_9FLAO|nr:hypothetical protein [Gramella oceanisediminis]MCP9199022.1 hypothetical protein [Gramella oceanisediminis]